MSHFFCIVFGTHQRSSILTSNDFHEKHTQKCSYDYLILNPKYRRFRVGFVTRWMLDTAHGQSSTKCIFYEKYYTKIAYYLFPSKCFCLLWNNWSVTFFSFMHNGFWSEVCFKVTGHRGSGYPCCQTGIVIFEHSCQTRGSLMDIVQATCWPTFGMNTPNDKCSPV